MFIGDQEPFADELVRDDKHFEGYQNQHIWGSIGVDTDQVMVVGGGAMSKGV